MFQKLKQNLRCIAGPVPDFKPRPIAIFAWCTVLAVRLVRNALPTKQNREFRRIAREALVTEARGQATIYFTFEYPRCARSAYVEPRGFFVTLEDAIADCTDHFHGIAKVETGRHYALETAETVSISMLYPRCPKSKGWQNSKGLAVEGRESLSED